MALTNTQKQAAWRKRQKAKKADALELVQKSLEEYERHQAGPPIAYPIWIMIRLEKLLS